MHNITSAKTLTKKTKELAHPLEQNSVWRLKQTDKIKNIT